MTRTATVLAMLASFATSLHAGIVQLLYDFRAPEAAQLEGARASGIRVPGGSLKIWAAVVEGVPDDYRFVKGGEGARLNHVAQGELAGAPMVQGLGVSSFLDFDSMVHGGVQGQEGIVFAINRAVVLETMALAAIGEVTGLLIVTEPAGLVSGSTGAGGNITVTFLPGVTGLSVAAAPGVDASFVVTALSGSASSSVWHRPLDAAESALESEQDGP